MGYPSYEQCTSTAKFIYITPFTDEVERIISDCISREFVQPSNEDGTKLEDIKRLISEGADIASTHSLFQRVDAELLDLLASENYTLILDEVMNVIAPLEEYTKSDLRLLYSEGIIKVDDGVLYAGISLNTIAMTVISLKYATLLTLEI